MDELTFTISTTVIASVALAIIGKVLWLIAMEKLAEVKERRRMFMSHLESFALLEQRVEALENQANVDRRNRMWVGECIWKIGSRMRIVLPDRPD